MSPGWAFAAGAVLGGAVCGLLVWAAAESRARRYGRMFSFAMHEINTPLTAVNMTVINLLSGVFGPLPPDLERWVGLMRDQVSRMTALVGDVRDLVYLELRREPRADVEPVEPGAVVEEALAAARRVFASAGIELREEVRPALPKVLADADHASRALLSLLFHARKFRLDGPVSLRARAEGRWFSCDVEYSGPRLSPEEARASLDLFYPARSRPDQVLAATGLGLGLTRTTARRLGGDLDFSVDPAGRARLTLRLPVA